MPPKIPLPLRTHLAGACRRPHGSPAPNEVGQAATESIRPRRPFRETEFCKDSGKGLTLGLGVRRRFRFRKLNPYRL